MNVYVCTEDAQWIASEVLKYSIRRRSSIPLNIFEQKDLALGLEQHAKTGFSIYRFNAPKAAGYQGRALVLDADIVCFADVAELANMPMTSAAMARHRDQRSFATSVLLLDCEKLKHWDVAAWAPALENRNKYQSTMWGKKGGFATPDLSPMDKNWNQLDAFPDGTKMIHYTNLGMQPWRYTTHKLGYIFLKELRHAIENGAITKEQVIAEEVKGHVYQGLLADAMKA